MLCCHCLHLGYCRKRKSLIVTDRELENPEFLRDVRTTAASLDILPSEWLEQLYDWLRDYPGRIVNGAWQEMYIRTEELEAPFFREWMRNFLRPVPANVKPRLRMSARERVRVVASILRATFPKEAMKWGLRPT